MLKNKPVLTFFIKLIVVFAILAAPLPFYDSLYGNFYRSAGKFFFKNFRESGIVVFTARKDPTMTHIDLGNLAHKHPNGAVDTATADFSTRYRGYIPTILLLSLIFASPVSIKRRGFAAVAGTLVMTGAIMVKQWIHLKYMCTQAKWLMLYDFTESEENRINFLYTHFANYSGPTLMLAVALWILFTFRKKDLDLIA